MVNRRTWDPRTDLAEEAAKDVHGLIRRQCPECGGSYIAHCIPCAEAANAVKAAEHRQLGERWAMKLIEQAKRNQPKVSKARSETTEERQARELADLY